LAGLNTLADMGSRVEFTHDVRIAFFADPALH
jgi:hypothetical protein